MTEAFIWIVRWDELQHYAPERDRAPAWIKLYTRQLDDDAYRNLTTDQRGLLHDLVMAFARAHGKLTMNTRGLTHRLGYRVVTPQLQRLNDAGLIEFVSRETLEQRLEQLYSRARPRAREEVEVEKETTRARARGRTNPPEPGRVNGPVTAPACPHCGIGGGTHTDDCPTVNGTDPAQATRELRELF